MSQEVSRSHSSYRERAVRATEVSLGSEGAGLREAWLSGYCGHRPEGIFRRGRPHDPATVHLPTGKMSDNLKAYPCLRQAGGNGSVHPSKSTENCTGVEMERSGIHEHR
ncbi:hypothetical protein [Cyclobacterium roseum]|uniref:hypothetical protein n=1 Tax=Cyclobacterium roseum TaxID=2666137 RepID=UPI001F29832A|nr:hypothetical protein [Cyclobacterium roseum]